MTLSAKLCIALVALALTAGGALAATTTHGSRSNSDNKTTTGGTTTPGTPQSSQDRLSGAYKRNLQGLSRTPGNDQPSGCTNSQNGGMMGATTVNNSKSNNYRTAQGSATGGAGGGKVHTAGQGYRGPENQLSSTSQPCTGGTPR